MPRLGRSAGESRIVVRRVDGQSNRLLMMAIRQRSRASLRAASGRPTSTVADLAGRDVGLDLDEVADSALERHRVAGGERHQASPSTWSTMRGAASGSEHGDQVDADVIGPDGVLLGPPPRQPVQPLQPGVVDRLVRRAAGVTAPGLDLAGHQHVAVAQHQVELALGAAPVAVEQHHPALEQVPRGHRLAVRTQRLSAGRGRRHVVTSCAGESPLPPTRPERWGVLCGEALA